MGFSKSLLEGIQWETRVGGKNKMWKTIISTNFSKLNFQKNVGFIFGWWKCVLMISLSRFLLFSWPQFCWSKKHGIDQAGYCPNSGSCNAIQMLAQGGISVSGGFWLNCAPWTPSHWLWILWSCKQKINEKSIHFSQTILIFFSIG